jgi:hypothetical protein
VLGAGADTRIQLGAFVEVILAIAGVATAAVLLPILKRQSEGVAIGRYSTATAARGSNQPEAHGCAESSRPRVLQRRWSSRTR